MDDDVSRLELPSQLRGGRASTFVRWREPFEHHGGVEDDLSHDRLSFSARASRSRLMMAVASSPRGACAKRRSIDLRASLRTGISLEPGTPKLPGLGSPSREPSTASAAWPS